MKDERSSLEKILWNLIGEPLYYCEECLRTVHVKQEGDGIVVRKNCSHTDSKVIAPRKAYLSGKRFAGLKTGDKVKATYQQVASKITGRNV